MERRGIGGSTLDSTSGPPRIAAPNPFVGVQSSNELLALVVYWSGSADGFNAWIVDLFVGYLDMVLKEDNRPYVWPVRGGP